MTTPVDPFAGSFVLHEQARGYYWEGAGALSIKSFYGGRAHYRTGGGQAAVDDGTYLVINAGQPYSITIESETPVESLCVFFGHGLAERAYRDLSAGADARLDDPEAPGAPVSFYDRTYPHDTTLSPALQALRAALPRHRGDAGWLAERLHELVERLLQVQHGLRGPPRARSCIAGCTGLTTTPAPASSSL